MSRRSAAERVYALLLRLVPDDDLPSWRQDARETFRDLYRDARRRGRAAGLLLVLRLALSAAAAGLRGRLSGPGGAGRRRRRGLATAARTVRDDLYLAARGLRRRPGFTVAVIAVLALGIGAATVVWSVVDCILVRPLPYPHAERLLFFDEGAHPGPLFRRWQQGLGSFETLAAARDRSLDLTGGGPPLEVAAAEVSADFFVLFGATPAVGRLLDGDDLKPGARVAVLGADLWRRRWGGDPAVVGRTIHLEGEPWTVVGVVDERFVPPEILVGNRVDVYVPLDFTAYQLSRWDIWTLSAVGRLRPDAGMTVAQQEVDAVALAVAAEQPDQRQRRDGDAVLTPLVPLHRATVGRVENALLMLLGAVGLMLAVGSANVAGLFLARGSERRREMSLRLALGARPARLAGQLLIESVSLALAGGLAGIGVAFALTRVFRRLVPADLPRFAEVAVDLRVLAAAVAVAVVTGVVFGLAPALQAARARADGALRNTAGSATANRSTNRLRSALVVAEVAMAVMLLCGAGLLGHSLVRLMGTELGFEPTGLARLQVRLGEGYSEEQRLRFARDLLERVEGLPGVEAAALGWTIPLDNVGDHRCCWRSRFTTDPDRDPLRSLVHPVSPGYFHALGARLLAGREIGWDDEQANPVPVVVNRTFAERLFPQGGAIGRAVSMSHHALVVVGVVDDVRRWGAAAELDNAIYVPYFRYGGDQETMRLVARTANASSAALAGALRAAVWELDPELPVGAIATLDQRFARSLAEPRFYSLLLGGFAALGLLLCAVGLWGVLLYTVNQRRRELGIRLAVGAAGSDLLRLILGQGMLLVAAGLGLGLLGALAFSRLVAGLIHGITATDPATYLGVCGVLVAVALVASYLPARRASRIDPIQTLRAE